MANGEFSNFAAVFSRHAAIYEAEEEGEPEVSSTPPPNLPECPGAPRKAKYFKE